MTRASLFEPIQARADSDERVQRDMTNAIRFLAADAVQAANSGHPGAPLGMAEIAWVLWTRHLRHNPAHPSWINRDRFVLSNGHGSMLLYALLHLTGYDLPLDELKRFRQLHSKTPGHPELGMTPGVETTTGPLGQGLSNGVGMALAEALLAREFNRDGHAPIDHHTYVFLGDGCLMEGISHEVASLAGTLGLGKLICFYDDNGISIDGDVKHWFTDDTPKRFEAYGWHVVPAIDGHDTQAIERALVEARARGDAPSLLCCRTVIGKGSPGKAGSHDVHGAPLGNDDLAAMRASLGWSHAPFEIPADTSARWNARKAGQRLESEWQLRFDAYARAFPELAAELKRRIARDLPVDFIDRTHALIAQTQAAAQTIATRKASQNALDALAPLLPELLGGSADLTGSNLTNFKGAIPVRRDGNGPAYGNHINYGVREFGMSAVMNGIALHGGYLPYGGTFLTFSDYSRNAIRMAALMRLRVIHVLTHDSIGLGEDGPTHQPVEHVTSLRLIPDLRVWRPCDATETAAAWIAAIARRDGPTALILSRQNLTPQPREDIQVADIARGGYILADDDQPHAVAIATGSEVDLAMKARAELGHEGIRLRVVSMPCMELFASQGLEWRERVLPTGVPRIAIEAGSTMPWHRFVGESGIVIGLDRFGESAPAPALFELFGITAANLVSNVRSLLSKATA
ncbi:MAG: transketolase [Dokdonella sp.]|uniref:transketolase n=1 Tax=Dokdonella sp. TaxID=2291710 RepID=UPI003264C6F3